MTTFADLIEEVESHMQSFGANSRDKMTSLSSDIGATDTTFNVDDGRQVDRGYLQIGDELINVATFDPSSGLVTTYPWGRGVGGTVAQAHSAGSRVTVSPRFPRFRVKAEINIAINSIFPQLFNVTTNTSLTASAAVVTYPVPSDVESIVRVQYQSIGPSKQWTPVTRYSLDYSADATAFPTGKSLDIYGPMAPGRPVKIIYRRKMLPLVNETDTLTGSLIQESWRDIIRLGACANLIMAMDPGRLELDSIESTARAGFTQPLQASSIARQFTQLQLLRIEQERSQLLGQYPTNQVRTS